MILRVTVWSAIPILMNKMHLKSVEKSCLKESNQTEHQPCLQIMFQKLEKIGRLYSNRADMHKRDNGDGKKMLFKHINLTMVTLKY